LDEVREALTSIGIQGLTVTEARGFGRQKGQKEIYRGAEYEISFLTKIRLEAVFADGFAQQVVDTIHNSAVTGQIGDGKIFVFDVQKTVRNRPRPSSIAAILPGCLISTALVLMMTIPGLALFYGGMVRRKNVLSVLMQCFAITCLMSILWMVIGYSLAFAEGTPYIGGRGKMFLGGLTVGALNGTIPDSLFMLFQMTFAIITPALIVGAFADRMKFSAILWFTGLWLLIVYAPVTHWVWGG